MSDSVRFFVFIFSGGGKVGSLIRLSSKDTRERRQKTKTQKLVASHDNRHDIPQRDDKDRKDQTSHLRLLSREFLALLGAY